MGFEKEKLYCLAMQHILEFGQGEPWRHAVDKKCDYLPTDTIRQNGGATSRIGLIAASVSCVQARPVGG